MFAAGCYLQLQECPRRDLLRHLIRLWFTGVRVGARISKLANLTSLMRNVNFKRRYGRFKLRAIVRSLSVMSSAVRQSSSFGNKWKWSFTGGVQRNLFWTGSLMEPPSLYAAPSQVFES